MGLRYFWAIAVVMSCADAEVKKSMKSLNLDPVPSSTWGLPDAEFYEKVFEITDKNHETKVMKSEDAWIVIFCRKHLNRKWRQLADSIGGAVWFGTVDVDRMPKLAKKVKLDIEKFDMDDGVAVVYPMESEKKEQVVRKGKLRITDEPRQAELFASATIPDRSSDFDFLPATLQDFSNWIVKRYYGEQPPKFPVLVLTDDTETPVHVKVLSHYMHSHFSFGIVRKSSVPAMRRQFHQVPEPQKYPTYLILLGQEPSSEEMATGNYNMKFNIMPFLEQKYGEPGHIRSLIKFLFTANDDYRDSLPGLSSAEDAHVSSMKSIGQKLSKRVKHVWKEESKKRNSNKSEL